MIERRYCGIRINSDDLRAIISRILNEKRNEKEQEREALLKEYLTYFIDNYHFSNGLVILDSGIERKYQLIYDHAKKNKFSFFSIGLEITKQAASERSMKRTKQAQKHFNREVVRWIRENKEFRDKYKLDYSINSARATYTDLFTILDRAVQ